MPSALVALDLRELLRDGLLRVAYAVDADFAPLAKQLGAIQHRRVLEPQDSRAARAGTLSAIHGRGAFPRHTDGAGQRTPPRWLLMRALTPTSTNTLLYDATPAALDPDSRRLLSRPCVVSPGGARYRTLLKPLSPA